jgi:hypothetical protein
MRNMFRFKQRAFQRRQPILTRALTQNASFRKVTPVDWHVLRHGD